MHAFCSHDYLLEKKAEKLFEITSDSDAKKCPCLSDIKEGRHEREEEEECLQNKDWELEFVRSVNLNNSLKSTNGSFGAEEHKGLTLPPSAVSDTSSDEEFYDVPEYPLESGALSGTVFSYIKSDG